MSALTISFATLTVIICIISLSIKPSTSMRKAARTTGSVLSLSPRSSLPKSIRLTFGGEISIYLLNIVDRLVATAPII